MAIELTDLSEAYTASAVFDFDREPIVPRLMDRSGEALAMSANGYKVHIPKPDMNVAVNSYTRGSDTGFGTMQQPAQEFVTVTVDQNWRVSNGIPYDDEDETEFSYFDNYREAQTRGIGKHTEDTILTGADGWTFATAQTIAEGSASKYIAPDGSLTGTNASKMPYNVIRRLSLALATQNVLGPASLDPLSGNMSRGAWLLVRPEIFDVLSEYFLDKNLHFDRLNESLLVSNSIFEAQPYQGMLKGIAIFSTSALKPASSTRPWVGYGGLVQGWTLTVKPGVVQTFSPQTNPDDSDWMVRQKGRFGYNRLNSNYLFKYTIHQKA